MEMWKYYVRVYMQNDRKTKVGSGGQPTEVGNCFQLGAMCCLTVLMAGEIWTFLRWKTASVGFMVIKQW